MPIRQGKAKLWFNTKQEQVSNCKTQDEFDDKMIAAIQIQSMNYEDQNFTPVFTRAKQEMFLELSEQARSSINRVFDVFIQHKITNVSDYVDKYHTGKRDHTFWREWTIEKFSLGYVGSYLLLRELPIRNFYARTWIMLAFLSKVAETYIKGFYIVEDEWTNKAVKNYGVYNTLRYRTPPSLDNRLPEEALWKLNQPGFLKDSGRYVDTAISHLLGSKQKVVAWDGTFNMPLEGLAHPKSKDSKYIDFIYE